MFFNIPIWVLIPEKLLWIELIESKMIIFIGIQLQKINMSTGNPKKFKKLEKFKGVLKEEKKEEVAKVYKDKNHEVKKALAFKTDKDKPKLT